MKAVDLFAGCGGMSLGFSLAGFSVERAYDNWSEAIECYRANFEHEIRKFDLGDYDALAQDLSDIKVDAIIGGPPCQDFSHAGKRKEGKRASLTEAYARIVASISPEWYVMENVDRTYKSQSYQVAREIFKESGYGISEIILDASFCGVPQKRKRFFSIGKLHEMDGFLLTQLEESKSQESMTMRDYFGNELGFEFYYRHPRNYNRRGIFSIDEPAPTVRGVNRPVPSGYPGHPKDPVSLASYIRALTTQERAWIQTFPKNFKLVGSKTAIEQMIGNAVPVNLAKFIGANILKYEKYKCLKDMKKSQLEMNF